MPTPKQLALGLVVGGSTLVIAGLALIYPPAAFVVGGLGAIAAGLFGVEVE